MSYAKPGALPIGASPKAGDHVRVVTTMLQYKSENSVDYDQSPLDAASAEGNERADIGLMMRLAAEVEHCDKILVIDDSLVTRRYLAKTLRRSGVCERVESAPGARSALELIKTGNVDLVLCDLNMPNLNGLDFLDLLKKEPIASGVPVIMLTGEEGVGPKVRCLESGASDYLVKPFSEEELVARVRIHLRIRALQNELLAKNEQLRRQACLDGLTGVSNRHYFLENLGREINRAHRSGIPLSLAMIDIDHFKDVNDTRGHLCGDRTLARVAELLREGLREYDQLGRYGGEEFVALFVDAGPELATRIADRCRVRVASTAMTPDDLHVTVSIGVVSTSSPVPGMAEELISRADEALYLAKNRGRNRVVAAPHVT